jgi:ribosomal protein S21
VVELFRKVEEGEENADFRDCHRHHLFKQIERERERERESERQRVRGRNVQSADGMKTHDISRLVGCGIGSTGSSVGL